ncbi:hypothetical protein FRC11_006018 [Ceratobasidium sp. 423]|nr:hypothetical protein FRC11_006018 [Ceratobasidium sp. 423]
MSHIDEMASGIDYEYPDDENLDAEWDPEPELDEPPRDPEPEATTQHREQYEAVSAVVKMMNEHGLRYPWSTKALKVLLNLQMEKMKKMVLEHTCFWSYDNLRLSKAIKVQCGDQHTVTDNGTVMTVIQIPDHVEGVFMREAEVDTQRSKTESRDESATQLTPSMEEEPVPQAAIPVVDVPQVTIDYQVPPGLPPAPVLETPDIAQPNTPSSETPLDEPHMLTWDDFSDFARFARIAAYNKFLILNILFETARVDVQAR